MVKRLSQSILCLLLHEFIRINAECITCSVCVFVCIILIKCDASCCEDEPGNKI